MGWRPDMILPEAIPLLAALWYDAVVSRRVLSEQYKRIASTIDLTTGFVLDLGTGPGDLAIEIASGNPRLEVLGIDLSAAMISLARRKANQLPNVRFRVMNAARLLLPDSCVDLVVSTGSMHHWREPGFVFDEVYRALKPGGRALLYDIRSDAERQEIFAELPHCISFPPKLAIVLAFRLHGFTRKTLQSRILPIIRSGPFAEARVETVGIWVRLSLSKE